MTKLQKTLVGATIVASLGAGVMLLRLSTAPTSTPGYWHVGATIEIPCVLNMNPYLTWTNPVDGNPAYVRYDASAMKVALTVPSGHYGGQGGSDHTTQYYLDGMLVPLRGGAGYVYPAPYRDSALDPPPPPPPANQTICDVYRQLNGAAAKPCPSNDTFPQYSLRIRGVPQFIAGYNYYKPIQDSQCLNQPTPSRTASVTFVPTVTPTVAPAITCLPTKVVTVVVTATSKPAPTRTPCIGPVSGCPTPTPCAGCPPPKLTP